MLKLNLIKNNDRESSQITFNDIIINSDLTFIDDPNKLMEALTDILTQNKSSVVCNICDDYESSIFVFISNVWEEKAIIIKDKYVNSELDESIVFAGQVNIKNIAKSFLNSDLLEYIESLNNTEQKELYKSLKSNYDALKKAVENSSTIYEREMKRIENSKKKK
jgi:hypothetical protein